MVSELSARLMRGHNFMNPGHAATTSTFQTSNCGSNNTNRVVSPNPISDHEPMMSISACTEKLDQISTKSVKLSRKSPPAATSASAAADRQGCFKRRKVDELQFAAARVKDDLAQGGLSYPALDTSLRHHLDFDRNDDNAAAITRGISLVSSKSVSESPFLTKNSTFDVYGMASMCDYGDLFSATYDSYSKPTSSSSSNNISDISRSNCSGGSIIGSGNATYVTNSDVGSICSFSSENSSSEGISHIEPRLEDALNNKKNHMEEVREAEEQMTATAAQRRAIYSNPITIRDAFENSDEARIVTLSFAPFLVVHVNPAYTRLTGLSPADILGKPFHEVIEDPTCKSNTSKSSSLTGLHEKVTSFVLQQSKGDSLSSDMSAADINNNFGIHISVVGPEPDLTTARPNKSSSFVDHKSFTHYMISLAEHEESKEEEDDEVEDDDVSVSTPTVAAATLLPLTTSVPTAVSPTNTTTNHLVVSSIPILEPSDVALMPTMRLHCGVMG